MVTMNFPDSMLLVLSRIGDYARREGLTPQDVDRLFSVGIAARAVLNAPDVDIPVKG